MQIRIEGPGKLAWGNIKEQPSLESFRQVVLAVFKTSPDEHGRRRVGRKMFEFKIDSNGGDDIVVLDDGAIVHALYGEMQARRINAHLPPEPAKVVESSKAVESTEAPVETKREPSTMSLDQVIGLGNDKLSAQVESLRAAAIVVADRAYMDRLSGEVVPVEERDALAAECDELKEKLGKLTGEFHELRGDYELAREASELKVSELQTTLDGHARRAEELEAELFEVMNKLEDLEGADAKADELEKLAAEYRGQATDLEAKLRGAEARIAQLEEKLDASEGAYKALELAASSGGDNGKDRRREIAQVVPSSAADAVLADVARNPDAQ